MAAELQQLPRLTRRQAAGAVGLACIAATLPAHAQNVSLAGRMGDRALLVIDGRTQVLGLGQTAEGVKLLRWVDDSAEVESRGDRRLLRVGATPAQLGATPPRTGPREIVLTADAGGHFTAAGTINGKQVRFMVDTGATLVALGRDEVARLGIDLSTARTALTQTANGTVPVQIVVLTSVRVGDVELANVGAAVMPQAMPVVLLGNSFLSRLQMKRENDVMRLEMR